VIARRAALLALALASASWSLAGAQTMPPPAAPAPMRMAPVPPPTPFHVVIDATTLAGLTRRTISATDEGGHTNTYSGFSLEDLLLKQGLPHGGPVRGKAMLTYVMISAADGYHVLYTLPELDASYTDHIVLIADTRDGQPFLPDSGPYRLITPFDKRDARWVKQVTAVDVQNVTAP